VFIRLGLKNWRSVDSAEIELAPFTTIVGKNSSGKSNVVDALLFASEITRDAATAVSKRGGIVSVRRWSPSKPYDVTVDVTVAKSQAALETDSTRHAFTLHSGSAGDWHFKREDFVVKQGGKQTLAVHRKANGEVTSTADSPQRSMFGDERLGPTTSAMLLIRQFGILRRPAPLWLSKASALRPAPQPMRQPQPPSESAQLTEDASNVGTALRAMKEAERAEVVLAMSRIVPGLVDVRADLAGRYVVLTFIQRPADHDQEFQATEMSDGALRALAVLVAAQQMSANQLLVVEEPEVNLHPGAANVVYDVLHGASRRGAVLVTTHSPELLDHSAEDSILVCEYTDGVTKIGPLATSQRELVRNGLFSTAELMRSEDLRREGAEPEIVSEVR